MIKLLKTTIGLLFGVIIFLGMLYSGISDLTNTVNKREVNLIAANKVLIVNDTIGGVIPAGNRYFYFGLGQNDSSLYIIQAPKNWLEKNFDKDFNPKNKVCRISALQKQTDSKIAAELEKKINELDCGPFVTGSTKYYDISYKKHAAVKLITAFLILLVFILKIYDSKTKFNTNRKFKYAGIVSWLIIILLVIDIFVLILKL